MVIHIHVNSKLQDENHSVHYMPCVIHSDGEANVSKYFENCIQRDKENGQVLNASFRGHPLLGMVIPVPHSYQGIVLREMKPPLTDDGERNLYMTHSFKSLTYWNWDLYPSRNDAFVSALDWIDIAEALHAPIENDK